MYRALIICGIAALASSNANAVEALSTEELVSHCIYYEDQPERRDPDRAVEMRIHGSRYQLSFVKA